MKQTKKRFFVLLMFAALISSLADLHAHDKLKTGAERLDLLCPMIAGKQLALVVNQTAVVGDAHTHLLDTLLARGMQVKLIMAPEHGFRGKADAGEKIANGCDPRTGIPILSLYGKQKKPSKEQLKGIDLVIFDIQDVGARFYTYISTMHYIMEACSEANLPLIILDRPNPNDYVEGPVLQPAQRSFVGMHPIPVLHGLTIGELAQMINGEKWISKPCDLTVIPLSNWKHGDPYSLPVPPSPNLPNDTAIRLYPSLCLFEATSFSVGRGTPFPFQAVGYPDKNMGSFAFTPVSTVGSDKNPLQKNKQCYGIDYRNNTDIKGFDLQIFIHFYRLFASKEQFITRPDFFDLLAGNNTLRAQIIEGKSYEEIKRSWRNDLDKYLSIRKKYLLYDDNRCLLQNEK